MASDTPTPLGAPGATYTPAGPNTYTLCQPPNVPLTLPTSLDSPNPPDGSLIPPTPLHPLGAPQCHLYPCWPEYLHSLPDHQCTSNTLHPLTSPNLL